MGAVVVLAAFVVLVVSGPMVVTTLRHAVFDGYQRIFPLQRVNEPVVIVTIDQKSLKAIGQWPWSRVQMAELVNKTLAY